MSNTLLYSTNPWFAINVAKRYRGNRYYAWCSEYFSAEQEADPQGSLIAASADPKTIYEQAHRAVVSEDANDFRLDGYRRTFKRLAKAWFESGELSEADRDEIRACCVRRTWSMWRPYLFVIPRAPLETAGRLVAVPRHQRAATGTEYILTDLGPDEFDIVRLPELQRAV